jgi:hypothetical protein
MPVDQLAIQALSLPTEVPGSPATSANFSPNTQSSFSALAGSGATPAPMFNDYSTNTTDGNALVGSGSNAVSSDGITGVAVDQVGGNTGGVVGANVEPGDYKAMIPETIDSLEQQEDEFIDTISQGYTATSGAREGKTAYGKTAARYARRDDRIDDRADRRAARDKIKAEGGTAKQGRQKKRQMRKADKAERKEAWTSYKGEADLSSREDI